MGQENLEKIAAELANWDLLQNLPEQIKSFRLVKSEGIKGQVFILAAYVDETTHCRLDIIYAGETCDFMVVKIVGLHVFVDECSYSRDRDDFGKMLLAKLPEFIRSIDRHQPHAFDYEAQDLHFEEWDYWHKLPEKIGDYTLFITPDNPLPYINGSFIFLDYVDFSKGNELYLAYNVFRNEIFAELKHERMPLTTNIFDVPSKVPDHKKLVVLSDLLAKKLHKVLEKLPFMQ